MSMIRRSFFRMLALMLCLLLSAHASASCGEVYYGMTSQGLVAMSEFILLMTIYVKYLLHAVAALVALYSAAAIYAKIQNGDEGFGKSVQMLVGAGVFMFAIELIFPAFFGITF